MTEELKIHGSPSFSLLDKEDYMKAEKYKWYLSATGYAIRQFWKNSKPRTVYLHKFIFDNPDTVIDHINGNRLDNRRINLRFCTQSQNLMNRIKRKRLSSSKYKGVYFRKDTGKFVARIKQIGTKKHINLGCFVNELDAAKAYNAAAIEYFGEFAKLNDLGH